MHHQKLCARFAVATLAAAGIVVGTGAAVAPAGATTVSWPQGAVYTTDLLAGQTIDAGNVSVKYDNTKVYVDVTGVGWCLTEVSVMPGPTYPMSRGGPIPGKFAINNHYSSCIADTGWLQVPKPAGWDGTVAVNASVWELASESTKTLYSDHNADVTTTTGGSPVTTVVADSTYWPTPCAGALGTAEWIWGGVAQPPNPATVDGDTLVFTRQFTVAGWPTGGSLQLTADDAYLAKLNGATVGSDALWTTCESYATPTTAALMPVRGINALTFRVTNAYTSDPAWQTWNPAGLIYKAAFTYYAHSEGAWAKGVAFDGANWAMKVVLPSVSVTSVSVTNGWDDSTGTATGTVAYFVYGHKLFINYTLDAAAGDHVVWIAGAHFFNSPADNVDPGVGATDAQPFGAGTFVGHGTGIVRDGVGPYGADAWDFTTFDTNATSGGSTGWLVLSPNTGTYYAQFTVRVGPVCPGAGCGVAYRTGAPFGAVLQTLTI